jgi:hypothetical protein
MLAKWNAGDGAPSVDALKWATESIIFTLACISHNCPDPWHRRVAQMELMHPVFFREWMRIKQIYKGPKLH